MRFEYCTWFMIIQRYHSKGKTSIWYLLSWVLHLYKGFTIWSWTSCLVLIGWLFSHSQTSYNSIENLPMIVSETEFDHLLVGFESRVSSSIRCESYLSWIWISSWKFDLWLWVFQNWLVHEDISFDLILFVLGLFHGFIL